MLKTMHLAQSGTCHVLGSYCILNYTLSFLHKNHCGVGTRVELGICIKHHTSHTVRAWQGKDLISDICDSSSLASAAMEVGI